jgi:DNA-binding transcriptional MerR regulator
MPFDIIIRPSENEEMYPEKLAAYFARVSLDFLNLCEQEGMVQARRVGDKLRLYTLSDIRQLTLIHRLYRELELDFASLEVVINLRQQVLDLQTQLDEVERSARLNERRLLREIQTLREMIAG